MSSFSLPAAPPPPPPSQVNITAPRIPNNRQKIIWNEEGINAYQLAIGDELTRLQETWGQASTSSPSCMALLLSSTYAIMNSTAAATNRVVRLGETKVIKQNKSPVITRLQRDVLAAQQHKVSVSRSQPVSLVDRAAAITALGIARGRLKRATRAQLRMQNFRRDSKLTQGFTALFKSITSNKAAASGKISSIRVGKHIYKGSAVPDGFYHSMKNLKHPDLTPIHNSPHYQSTIVDYDNIMKICKSSKHIPAISAGESADILYSVRAEVNDFFSITANHFIHAGVPGLKFHHFLLSTIIHQINLVGINTGGTAAD